MIRRIETEHEWDREDTILSLYYWKLIEKYTHVQNSRKILDKGMLELEMKKTLQLTPQELAEDVIGCSLLALDINAKVMQKLITGEDVGYGNPNQYQIQLSTETFTLEQLSEMSDEIVSKILKDKKRLKNNLKLKNLRLEKGIESAVKRSKKKILTEEELRKKEELKRDLRKAGIGKATALISTKKIAGPEEGSVINHPQFGEGKITSTQELFSVIEFPEGPKKVANIFLTKLLKNKTFSN